MAKPRSFGRAGPAIYLRDWRGHMLLTQEDLAARSGVTVVTISRLEAGLHRPHVATIHKLAAGLGVEPRDLLHPPEGS